jgi:hypothetical protein
MKKIIIAILISFFILGCKTKKILKNEVKEVEKVETISKTETTEKEKVKESAVEENKTVQKEDKKEEKTEVEITGKVDKENPVTYYNVIDGDTIDLFKIIGNADFIFKSSKSTQKSDVNNNSTTTSSNSKDNEKSISNAVENVKNSVKQVQSKTVQVVKQDFTIGSYIVFLIWGLAIIALIILIMWIRKSTWWTSLMSKFKK